MTSKSAFNKICKNLCSTYEYTDEYKKGKKRILKDLEMAKILKKHLQINKEVWPFIITCNLNCFRDEDFVIVAEWLDE